MILTIGNSGAYEIDAFQCVLNELCKRGVTAIMLKQDKCLQGDTLLYTVDGRESRSCAIIDGQEYDINDFETIWYMKPYLPKELLGFEPAKYRQMIHRQFYTLRESLWSLFGNKNWINDPWAMHKADNKIYQMDLALKLGFAVPKTLVTSDPDKVREFYKMLKGRMIVKLLAASPILDEVIYTNLVTPEYMKQIDSVKFSPSIFQECVIKDYELRVTVVGDKIFTVKIYSQEDEGTTLDWRRKPSINDFDVKMEKVSLPDTITRKIFAYLEKLGLRYGSFDFIVTPDGDYVFLDINPNGQWYFVQLRTEFQVASALADLLINKG